MIVGTFAALSMDPPLVTFSVTHTPSSWPKIAAADRFGISLLAEGPAAGVPGALGQGEGQVREHGLV